jgi:Helix-turn-helix family
MGEVLASGETEATGRRLARLAETFHTVAVYAPEIMRFTDHGFKGWWHAYFAFRPAPMGPVPAEVVTAAFYNFAPRMVERAVPGVWSIMAPDDVLALRLELVDEALRRVFGDGVGHDDVVRTAELLAPAVRSCPTGARPLFAAHAGLDWPDAPHLSLWQACTLLREHRGDSHGIALAAAGVDGVECHLLMAAHGHGNQASITGIRGWTDDEWAAAGGRLAARGWLGPDGEFTPAGQEARRAIEHHTDELSATAARLLGDDRAEVEERLGRLADHLLATGEVSGQWPPPHLLKD